MKLFAVIEGELCGGFQQAFWEMSQTESDKADWNETLADIEGGLDCEHLSDIKDDVRVLVGLVGVDALSVVPVQISTGWTVIRESWD